MRTNFRSATVRLAASALPAFTLPVFAQAPPPAGFPGERAPEGPPAAILELSAEPAAIEPGGSATLRWEAINTYSLSIDPDGLISFAAEAS